MGAGTGDARRRRRVPEVEEGTWGIPGPLGGRALDPFPEGGWSRSSTYSDVS